MARWVLMGEESTDRNCEAESRVVIKTKAIWAWILHSKTLAVLGFLLGGPF